MTPRAKNNLDTPAKRQVKPAQSNECSNPFQTRELYRYKKTLLLKLTALWTTEG